MRRLTNTQMEVLAQATVDKLEEMHIAKTKDIIESEEYKNFDKTYSDETLKKLHDTYILLQELQDQIHSLENQLDTIVAQAAKEHPNYVDNRSWKNKVSILTEAIEKYQREKKNEVYPNIKFEKEKLLTKIKAEILLSSIADPNELIKELTTKFEK